MLWDRLPHQMLLIVIRLQSVWEAQRSVRRADGELLAHICIQETGRSVCVAAEPWSCFHRPAVSGSWSSSNLSLHLSFRYLFQALVTVLGASQSFGLHLMWAGLCVCVSVDYWVSKIHEYSPNSKGLLWNGINLTFCATQNEMFSRVHHNAS